MAIYSEGEGPRIEINIKSLTGAGKTIVGVSLAKLLDSHGFKVSLYDDHNRTEESEGDDPSKVNFKDDLFSSASFDKLPKETEIEILTYEA